MRATQATVSLSAIRNNLKLASDLSPGSRNMAVIKSNAYGHGAVAVARALQHEADALAVAYMEEAVQLRDAGIRAPILVLQGAGRARDFDEAFVQDLWLMVHNRQQLGWALEHPDLQALTLWLKIDTGMHRLGIPVEEAPEAIELLTSSRIRQPVVLCTHLASADERDNSFTREQVASVTGLTKQGSLLVSIANSAGILFWPETHAAWNRPGYMLYGNNPAGFSGEPVPGLQAAMTVSSELIAIRHLAPGESVGYGQAWKARVPSVIGAIPVGYGDGYPRHAVSGTPVLVNGQRAPLAGRVSMDSICVDLTGLEQVRVGDPVELWGQNLSVDEVAMNAGTIGYEILAGLSGRIPLHYTS